MGPGQADGEGRLNYEVLEDSRCNMKPLSGQDGTPPPTPCPPPRLHALTSCDPYPLVTLAHLLPSPIQLLPPPGASQILSET